MEGAALVGAFHCHSERSRGMERVGRATWTAAPRGKRRESRETNEFNRSRKYL